MMVAQGPLQRLLVPPGSTRESRTMTMRVAIRDAVEWSALTHGAMPIGRVDDAVLQPAVADLLANDGDLAATGDAVNIPQQANVDDDDLCLNELA